MGHIAEGLERQRFDLVVIGAGINGAAVARDAAMRGLRVLLLDKGDVGSGTTGWSSRLIHGGLRYLEHFEIPLVRESLRERERLLRTAPHLVRPLAFLIPIYERSRRGPATIRAGMTLYDLLSFDKSLERHHMLSRDEVLAREPGLNPDRLKGAARYWDAQVRYVERLALENALSARRHGAVVATYARVDGFLQDGNAVRGVRFTDVRAGTGHSVQAAVTVNAGGPWVDQVLGGLDREAGRLMGGTKGSHLVVDPFPGAPREALYTEAVKDGRPYFILPWNERYLIGTTDLRYDGDLDEVVASDEEIDYLVSETNAVIPAAGLSAQQVLFTYAGVRPLPYAPEGKEGAITRSHIVHDHEPELRGLLSLVGGKITTYRQLAQETVDDVFEKLGRKSPKCRTADIPLPGATAQDFESFADAFAATSGLPETAARRLVHIYGTRAVEVMDLADDDPLLRAPVTPETQAIGAEVVFGFRHELAATLADVLMRRTMAGLEPGCGVGVDRAAADIAMRHLCWDEDRAESEVRDFRAYVKRFRAPVELTVAEQR
jgi:glycerol-3-phosphate dehydrogenase